jgi:hypothetical protein
MTTFGADYPSMDDLFPHYDPIEKFIVYVTHEQKAELMFGFYPRRVGVPEERR